MSDLIYGKNALIEYIYSKKVIHQVLISRLAKHDNKIKEIINLLDVEKIQYRLVDKKELDRKARGQNHQGILAIIGNRHYVELDDILEEAKSKNEKPFILILDGLEDPHNFGSIIRSAVGAGVHGIVIPNKKQVDITPTVVKTSVGATEHILIAKVSNVVQAAQNLQQQGVWIMGAHHHTKTTYLDVEYDIPLALVIGNEGKGISRLMLEKCDYLLKIPIRPTIESLNASVACAILLYKIKEFRL